MPIQPPPAPEGHGRSLSRALERVVLSPTGSDFLGWRFESPPRPRGLKPHPVYALRRDDVADGRLLEAARAPTAWRTLVQLEGDTLYAVELGTRPAEGEVDLPLLSLAKGPLGRATADGIRAAGRFESAGAPDVELRLLTVPALHFMAVWLHGPRGDTLLPVQDHPGGLQARRAYDAAEVLGVLQPLARAQRAAAAGAHGAEAEGETN